MPKKGGNDPPLNQISIFEKNNKNQQFVRHFSPILKRLERKNADHDNQHGQKKILVISDFSHSAFKNGGNDPLFNQNFNF